MMTNIGDRPTILLVDDDEDICHNMSDILLDLGYEVDEAYDGPTAIEKVKRKPYDVALLDLKMPGMDGLTLYREIKKIRAGTVALLVTAHAGGSTTEDALSAGAWQVLPKPVELNRLLPLVEQAVEQPLVLVIDDDNDLCENLWDILRSKGYRVSLAHDQSEAVHQLEGTNVRVVLIDMKLPGSSGDDVFRLVRQAKPEARTVLITGFRTEMDEMVARVLAEGADAVCYKPFDVPNLLGALAKFTRKNGSHGEEPSAPAASKP